MDRESQKRAANQLQTVWYLDVGTGTAIRRQLADRPALMRIVRTVADLRAALAPARSDAHEIGLVPTMGAFHEGHLSLMRTARAECDLVVVSLFVNPAQFGAGEDLGSYPRDEAADAAAAEAEGVDILFAPPLEEVYPAGFQTAVEVSGLTDVLCGSPASRGSGHFRGVTTVVAKLLNICRPDVVYLGQKDLQQSIVIERMVRDLDMPVRVVSCPIVRESNGLAMSSRNAYLTDEQRASAAALNGALAAAARLARSGASASELRERAIAALRAAGIEPEYLEVLDASDLSPLQELEGGRVVIAVAATIGPARLIDNVIIDLSGAAAPEANDPAAAAVAA
jgi:pantoate--beta-alanine ligase